MKRIIFVVAAAMVAVGANAQDFYKGDVFVKGRVTGLDLQFMSTSGFSNTNLGLNVGGGYFLSDNFACEAELGFDYYKAKDLTATNSVNFGLAIRYYPCENLYGKVLLRGNKPKGVDMASYLGAEVGYDYFLSDRVYVEPAVYFHKGIAKKADKGSYSGLSVGVGILF